jgi:hypothetical protein
MLGNWAGGEENRRGVGTLPYRVPYPGCKRPADLRTIQLLAGDLHTGGATHYNYAQGPDETRELEQGGVLSLGCVSRGEQEKKRNPIKPTKSLFVQSHISNFSFSNEQNDRLPDFKT